MEYKAKGFVQGSVAAIITLGVGAGIIALVLVFVSVLGAQAYSMTADKINAIADGNIKAAVQSATQSGFTTIKTVGDFTPMVVMAVMIAIILAILLFVARGASGGVGGGGGGAL